MTTHREFEFVEDSPDAVAALESIAGGGGWCNVTPVTEEELPQLRVNIFGLTSNQGVPVATFVTNPPRKGEVPASSLGLLHTRGRLGTERIRSLVGNAALRIRQDHNHRGLLLDVPVDTPVSEVLRVMTTLVESLCDFPMTGRFLMAVNIRD